MAGLATDDKYRYGMQEIKLAGNEAANRREWESSRGNFTAQGSKA